MPTDDPDTTRQKWKARLTQRHLRACDKWLELRDPNHPHHHKAGEAAARLRTLARTLAQLDQTDLFEEKPIVHVP